MQVKVHKDGAAWGEYVSAGQVYQVEAPRSRKGSYHFRNVAAQSGTFMQAYQFARAVKAGWVEVVGA